MITIEQAAKIAHETNRQYCQAIGEYSQSEWEFAHDWQRESSINQVKAAIKNPERTPEQSHIDWLEEKTAAGWKYGKVKDPDKKEHPCCVPYDQLPIEQRIKDALFTGVVKALLPIIEK